MFVWRKVITVESIAGIDLLRKKEKEKEKKSLLSSKSIISENIIDRQ